MRSLALFAIDAYQRHLSPYKGYCCAYSACTGHRSCSVLGYRAIRRHGVWAGVAILRRRFERCALAFRRRTETLAARRGQRGFCDLPCACDLPVCDLPNFDCPLGATDALDCCDCANWGSKRKQDSETKPPYVPVARWPDTRRR